MVRMMESVQEELDREEAEERRVEEVGTVQHISHQ
jgi:hypothetical protein